jgi:hypothetical protein
MWLTEVLQTTTPQRKCPPCGPVQGNGSRESVVRAYPQIAAPAVDSPTGSPAPPTPPPLWQVAWGPSPGAQCPTGVPPSGGRVSSDLRGCPKGSLLTFERPRLGFQNVNGHFGGMPRQRPLLVGTGEPAVSGNIRCKEGCEFPGLRHGSPFTGRQTSTTDPSRAWTNKVL